MIKRLRQSSITSNKGIVYKDMDIRGILKMEWWRAYLDNELSAKMKNKVSAIIGIKSSHVFTKRKYNQSNIKQPIVKKISWMLGPMKALINVAWIDLWIPLSGITKFVHACWKSRKSRKSIENSENAYQKENGNKRLLKSGFYA